jgi:hypothetical protein
MAALNLRQWAENCRLHEPERSDLLKVVRLSEGDDLRAFAQVCHDLVLDRPVSFTLAERIKLYRRWLGSEQPCLLAVHDGQGHVVATSIILPLTLPAFRAFWLEGLDALDIWPQHLVAPGNPQQHRYFLVDMLARNKQFIKSMRTVDQRAFCGIGFRAMLYHLSLFYEAGQAVEPVILCSTFNRDLGKLLGTIGFARQTGQGEMAAPIFQADFSQRNSLSADAQWLLNACTGVVQNYAQDRYQVQPKPALGASLVRAARDLFRSLKR